MIIGVWFNRFDSPNSNHTWQGTVDILRSHSDRLLTINGQLLILLTRMDRVGIVKSIWIVFNFCWCHSICVLDTNQNESFISFLIMFLIFNLKKPVSILFLLYLLIVITISSTCKKARVSVWRMSPWEQTAHAESPYHPVSESLPPADVNYSTHR